MSNLVLPWWVQMENFSTLNEPSATLIMDGRTEPRLMSRVRCYLRCRSLRERHNPSYRHLKPASEQNVPLHAKLASRLHTSPIVLEGKRLALRGLPAFARTYQDATLCLEIDPVSTWRFRQSVQSTLKSPDLTFGFSGMNHPKNTGMAAKSGFTLSFARPLLKNARPTIDKRLQPREDTRNIAMPVEGSIAPNASADGVADQST